MPRWIQVNPVCNIIVILGSFAIDHNSFVPGRCGSNIKNMISKFIIQNSSLGTHYEIVLRKMPENFTDEKSTLVQELARCRQATRHRLSQCWPTSMLKYGATRPQWARYFLWCHFFITPGKMLGKIHFKWSSHLLNPRFDKQLLSGIIEYFIRQTAMIYCRYV